MIPLAELFPDADYRFHLTLRRAELRDFFRAQDGSGRVLAERRRWLESEPARYAALQPEADAPWREFEREAAAWVGDAQTRGESTLDGPASVIAWGKRLEPDFLLLMPDDAGDFRLRGGALCFPTSWALEEKLGRTLDEIHAVVPGLNAALGPPIRQFLARLRPGPAYLRSNWGFAATPELNLHPSRPRPRLAPPLDPSRLWLRVEHQALALLPRSGGIVFAIRIALHPWQELREDPALRAGVRRALATMTDELAVYKGIAAVRAELLANLEEK